MENCKSNCILLSIIGGIVAAVALGVLYSLGFVATGIIFWVYVLVGILGILLSPLYAGIVSCRGKFSCFCGFRLAIILSAIGTIIAAAIGLIVSAFATVTVIAIVLGVATFFIATLLLLVVCLVNCLCEN